MGYCGEPEIVPRNRPRRRYCSCHGISARIAWGTFRPPFVGINPRATQHDPEVFPHPKKFEPERWLVSSEEQYTSSPSNIPLISSIKSFVFLLQKSASFHLINDLVLHVFFSLKPISWLDFFGIQTAMYTASVSKNSLLGVTTPTIIYFSCILSFLLWGILTQIPDRFIFLPPLKFTVE